MTGRRVSLPSLTPCHHHCPSQLTFQCFTCRPLLQGHHTKHFGIRAFSSTAPKLSVHFSETAKSKDTFWEKSEDLPVLKKLELLKLCTSDIFFKAQRACCCSMDLLAPYKLSSSASASPDHKRQWSTRSVCHTSRPAWKQSLLMSPFSKLYSSEEHFSPTLSR